MVIKVIQQSTCVITKTKEKQFHLKLFLMHSFNSIAVFKVGMEGGTRYKESYLDGPVKKKTRY